MGRHYLAWAIANLARDDDYHRDALAANAAEQARLRGLCPHPLAVSDADRGPHCPDCGSPVPHAGQNPPPGD